jgi:peptidoglycan hydrolase-like protein with peptidoglycan-binding domain
MTTDFATSNLSKIKTKFRTSGTVSQPRRKAGSSLNDLGGNGNIGITQQEYLNRLHYAFDNTSDPKLRQFLYQEIRKIHIQRGTW